MSQQQAVPGGFALVATVPVDTQGSIIVSDGATNGFVTVDALKVVNADPTVVAGTKVICANHTSCNESQFESQPATNMTDRVCSPITACPPDTFESAEPTASADRGCSPVTDCATDEYQTAAPTSTSDRGCSPLTVCDFSLQFQKAAPDFETDRVCQNNTVWCVRVSAAACHPNAYHLHWSPLAYL